MVGDNVDWFVNIHDERIGKHAHMQHAFATAAITSPIVTLDASTQTPQKDYTTYNAEKMLPSIWDMATVAEDYAVMLAHDVIKHVPFFYDYKRLIPPNTSENYEFTKIKSHVVPLSIIDKNEQYYGEVVEIMDHHVQLAKSLYTIKLAYPLTM